jgi:hypothetical protein
MTAARTRESGSDALDEVPAMAARLRDRANGDYLDFYARFCDDLFKPVNRPGEPLG